MQGDNSVWMHSIIWVFTREQPSSINSALSEEAVSHVRRKYFSLKLLKRRFVDKSYNLKLTSAYTKWIHCQNYYHLHKTIKHQMASSSSILCFILEHLNHVTVFITKFVGNLFSPTKSCHLLTSEESVPP